MDAHADGSDALAAIPIRLLSCVEHSKRHASDSTAGFG
jgi:hypothetical protein